MNNFEVIRLLNKMVDNTKMISINVELYFIMEGLTIDKKGH